MKTLLAVTDEYIKTGFSRLDADVVAGTNVALTLENNEGMQDTSYIVIGHEGSELAELEQINAAVTAGTQVRVATLKFNHRKGEPVTIYRYNQRKFYGATAAGGSYSELTSYGSPKDISVDNPQGTVIEYNGIEGYTYFKATYYNSTTTEETDSGDATETAGDESTRYTTLWDIRKHAGLAGNGKYSDLRLETKRKQAENEIDSVIFSLYVLPLTEVPALLSQICELLAAGYIDYEEFGKDGEGVKWLGEARALLTQIAQNKRRLIGADGTELTSNAKVGVLDGYPNASGTDAANFSMSDTF